jgi:hypothetical protein
MFDFKALTAALWKRTRQETPPTLGATRIIAELPRHEAVRALGEIVHELAHLNRNAKTGLKERFRAMLYFDEKAQPILRLLMDAYRGVAVVEGVSSRQLFQALLDCWQEMAAGYKVCLKQHAQAPRRTFAAQAELVTLRATAYYAAQASWSHLHHFEVEPRVWRNLHRFYQVAESAGFAQKPMQRYPDEPDTDTVRDCYLRALLLKLAEPERRLPGQIWQIERWLRQWQGLVRIEQVIRPRDQLFAVNLDEPKPPMKLRRNMVGERYRYLATSNLSLHVTQLAQAVAAGRDDTELGAIPTMERGATVQLLNSLAEGWSQEGQSRARRYERTLEGRQVSVTRGLPAIASFYPRPAGFELEAAAKVMPARFEEWAIEDESSGGLGAQFKAPFEDRLEVGEVIAVRPHEGKYPVVGVVRRVFRTRNGQVKAGIEKLGAQPVLVTLTAGERRAIALYLPACPIAGGQRALLMQQQDYVEAKAMMLEAGGKRYVIRLGSPIEWLATHLVLAFQVIESARPGTKT